jgi:hypothetical protein
MTVRGKITLFAVGAVVGSGALPGTAGAQRGLTVDPQSPAGVEYAIPLDSARGHRGSGHPGGGGSGGGGGTAGSGSPALFGSGITPPAKPASAGAKKAGSAGRRGARRKAPRHTGRASSQPRVAPVTASASYSTTGPLVGVVGSVLLLGGGLGLFLRLRARRSRIS